MSCFKTGNVAIVDRTGDRKFILVDVRVMAL
jgi:hypothetical protein